MRKSSRLTFDKKALSNAMSATILTVAVIALSLAVFRWGEGRASSYNNDFDRAVDRETAELKEKIIFEYVSYDKTSNDITVYLLNCGDIDDVEIDRELNIGEEARETETTGKIDGIDIRAYMTFVVYQNTWLALVYFAPEKSWEESREIYSKIKESIKIDQDKL